MRLFSRRKTSSDDPWSKWAEDEYARSDFGRVFGWWVLWNGEKIAELNYRLWDSGAQFWHEYYLVPHSNKFTQIGYDPNRWCIEDISLQSRYAINYSTNGILMALRREGVVSIRSVCIPKDVFEATFAQ